MTMRETDATVDTVDLAELARAAKRGWRFIAACTLLGAVLGLVVLFVGPRRYEAAASIVIRSSQGTRASLLSGLASGGAGGLLDAGTSSPLETEIQILSSRELIGKVVDSLRLQVQVRAPKGVASNRIVEATDLPGAFTPRRYTVSTAADAGIRITGQGSVVRAAPGQPVVLPIGRLTLTTAVRPGGSRTYDVQLLDREDAISLIAKRITVSKPGGEVLRIACRTSDSTTAAAIPNLLVDYYLGLRHTTDRGTNLHRVEFLTSQLDSVTRELTTAEQDLKRFQESSRLIDPQTIGKIQLERAATLRTQIGENDLERGALEQLMEQVSAGRMSVRDLAAYPTFLKSSAINAMLTQIGELETERSKLLVTRLDSDSDVVALSKSIRNLEGQLSPMATAYESSLGRQRYDMGQQLDSLQTALGAFPAALASGNRLQRNVVQLSQVHAALQAQLVDARVAAISEGGNVQSLDVAQPPMNVAFPRPLPVLAAGLGGGVFVGLAIALLMGTLGRWVQDPATVERATGVPALRFDPHVPLLLGASSARTILVAPVTPGVQVDAVVDRLVQTATLRSISAAVLDLTTGALADVDGTIQRLEAENGLVVVKLPTITSDTAAAAIREHRAVLLVAPERRIARTQLVGAVQMLKRLEVPCAGVVLNGNDRGNGRNGVVA
ncbi:MAG TPA: Wzz/FepE/Etk N-terminal domain-containing protein [Gemmatimonadaceae bacterium]|nr:Wzz/FepE/Etk N-terminal domain-containing protein [Gemmatimonadaceae bacterium]